MKCSVRHMTLEDVPRVSEIEREAFPPSWPPTNFRRELTFGSSTHYLVACQGILDTEDPDSENDPVDCDTHSPGSKFEALRFGLKRLFSSKEKVPIPQRQRILGFIGLWFMADEAHLANFAVCEASRRRGIGELLMISAIDLAMAHKARFITLEVRASNKVAQALYRKYGLVEVGIRRGYYSDNKDDAVIMTADMITSASYQNNFQRLRQAHVLKWEINVKGKG